MNETELHDFELLVVASCVEGTDARVWCFFLLASTRL